MSSRLRFDENFQGDGRWHHVCLKRVPHSSYLQVFADGTQINPTEQKHYSGLEFEHYQSELKLHVLPEVNQDIHLTGLGLWYNSFSLDEIAWLAQSCSNTPQNPRQVLTWSRVLPLVRNSPWYKTRSTCAVS